MSSQKDSLESEIARLIQDKTQFLTSPEGQAKMVQLARLRNELGGGMGMDAVLKDVDTLMDRMRWIQLENVPTQSAPFKEQWLNLELPLTTMQGETQQPMVKLRVAYQPKDKNRKIDPNNTHIMLHFDLGVQDESIDVDMAIVERKIGAQVIVSNQVLQPIAEDEMSTLADGLKELGYLLQTARCDLAHPKRASLSEIQSTSTYPENPLGSYNLRA